MDSLKLLVDMFFATFLLIRLTWPLWAILGLMLLVKLAFKLYKMNRLSKSGMAELDKLDGEDFEKYLELLFHKLGYQVKRTPYQGDYGADLVLEKVGVKTVVQAKRHTRSVGVKAIQEAITAKEYYKCNAAMVVTNSYYSQQAQKLAKANHVELWDRDYLVNTLLAVKDQTPIAVEPSTAFNMNMATVELTPSSQSSSVAICETCKKPVSSQVSNYCLSHLALFNGKVYCYEHQKVIKRQAASTIAN
jgi:restriction system protein